MTVYINPATGDVDFTVGDGGARTAIQILWNRQSIEPDAWRPWVDSRTDLSAAPVTDQIAWLRAMRPAMKRASPEAFAMAVLDFLAPAAYVVALELWSGRVLAVPRDCVRPETLREARAISKALRDARRALGLGARDRGRPALK